MKLTRPSNQRHQHLAGPGTAGQSLTHQRARAQKCQQINQPHLLSQPHSMTLTKYRLLTQREGHPGNTHANEVLFICGPLDPFCTESPHSGDQQQRKNSTAHTTATSYPLTNVERLDSWQPGRASTSQHREPSRQPHAHLTYSLSHLISKMKNFRSKGKPSFSPDIFNLH